ncbi:hypothetical protein PV382_35985 [Streptomyces scabiei]|nr:hypothetical protein [Streptomyces scabiei]MDX3177612.1 hypothetical protein [Streptomyces scabiei]
MRHNNGFRRAALATTAVTAFAAAVTAVYARVAVRKPWVCRMLASPWVV